MGVVETPVWLRACNSDWLIVCDVGCKTSDHRKDVHVIKELNELLSVVFPSKPPSMSSIHIDGNLGCQARYCVDSIGHSLTICVLSGLIGTSWITHVSCKIGQGIWFNECYDRNSILILSQELCQRVNVLTLVGLNSSGAIAIRHIVAGSIRIRCAADFAIRGHGMTIPVREIVDDEQYQRRSWLIRCVC